MTTNQRIIMWIIAAVLAAVAMALLFGSSAWASNAERRIVAAFPCSPYVDCHLGAWLAVSGPVVVENGIPDLGVKQMVQPFSRRFPGLC